MGWQDLAGQPLATRLLSRAVARGQVAHAYLFTGPPGTGKGTAARILAMALNCERLGEGGDPCGTCTPCRKIAAGVHPDVEVLSTDRGALGVEAMREMQRRAWLKPGEGRARIVILEEADRLTPQAQNSLLKILEDPPPEAVFVLLAANPAELLPTILSRCQQVTFPPLPPPLVEQVLRERHGLPAPAARLAAGLSGGSVGGALAIAREPRWLEQREKARELLAALPQWDDARCLQAAEELDQMKREELDAFLALLTAWLRDIAVWQHTADPDLVSGDPDFLATQAALRPPERTLAMFEAVERARRQLERNANQRLVLDVLLLGLRRQST